MRGVFGKCQSAHDAEHQSEDYLEENRTRAPSEHGRDPGRCPGCRARSASDGGLNYCGLTGMSSAGAVYARFSR
ncbi:hypothetical protein PCL1606_09120 [Pseudomonas chlororaphis]|uniref:Uncharacterized protein n=1 Tax=Pseudomonas chlororaphis TaxID=587753 RepID=A0A0D5XTG7_9PSED|nr:hypothetical protein PCL1606_09120 [Pseudomonas chlororaphis]